SPVTHEESDAIAAPKWQKRSALRRSAQLLLDENEGGVAGVSGGGETHFLLERDRLDIVAGFDRFEELDPLGLRGTGDRAEQGPAEAPVLVVFMDRDRDL